MAALLVLAVPASTAASLRSRVLAEFVRAVFSAMRRRARRELGIAKSRCGAVTFVQRGGDALNLNVHLHTIAIDGVYAAVADGTPVFYRLAPPDDDEIARVATRVARRIAHVLARQGDESVGDPLAEREPWLAALAAASVRGRTSTGQRPLRLGDQVDPEALDGAAERGIALCANVAGVGLHAGTTVPAHDRERLERLLRYAARPPLCNERLSVREDGRLLYRLKRRWRDDYASHCTSLVLSMPSATRPCLRNRSVIPTPPSTKPPAGRTQAAPVILRRIS